MKLFYQSLRLLFSFGFVFAWQKTPLSSYTIQIFGFFIFLYLILTFRKKGLPSTSLSFSKSESITIFILNSVILLLIASTGGLSSPLFFLLYFLAFGIAFVFEPITVFVFVLGAVLFFIQDAMLDDITKNLLMLGSLVLISPLAFFFGKEYRREEKQNVQIKNASEKITEDVEGILKENKDNLKSSEVEKLNDILEETERLREE